MDQEDQQYRDALHQYTRGLLTLLNVFDVRQLDVAQQLGVSPTLVTFWHQGHKLLPPQHDRALRRLIERAVAKKRIELATADELTLEQFRDHALIPILAALDRTAKDLTLAYVRRVRMVNRAAIAWIEDTLEHQACTVETTTTLQEAYISAQETLDRLQPVLMTTKANNRVLKARLTPSVGGDVRKHVKELLDYVDKVYGVQKRTAAQRDEVPRRKGRRPVSKI